MTLSPHAGRGDSFETHMAAETARKFEALETQAGRIMSVFTAAGYEAVSPAVIQPAGVFLDVVGETLRARTYVFTDPDGDELCLRPDLTVPTCRLHLERAANGNAPGRYCYNGTAFRFQPVGATSAHPREFRQAGIENFGSKEREAAEAETVATIVAAVTAAGLRSFKLRIGDLGLFRALLDAADMPARWRPRLSHHFWRPEAFRDELKRLTTTPGHAVKGLPVALASGLTVTSPEKSEQALLAYLTAEGIEPVGVRSLSEVTESLLAKVADASSAPLPAKTAAIIERYLAITAPARDAPRLLKDLARQDGVDVSAALEVYNRRLQLMSNAGIDITNIEFSAEFGRTLEYYTGFVFELVTPELGPLSPVAGGGRYDSLMRAVGAKDDVPAVGAAIHTERLLAAIPAELGSAQTIGGAS